MVVITSRDCSRYGTRPASTAAHQYCGQCSASSFSTSFSAFIVSFPRAAEAWSISFHPRSFANIKLNCQRDNGKQDDARLDAQKNNSALTTALRSRL